MPNNTAYRVFITFIYGYFLKNLYFVNQSLPTKKVIIKERRKSAVGFHRAYLMRICRISELNMSSIYLARTVWGITHFFVSFFFAYFSIERENSILLRCQTSKRHNKPKKR